MSGNELAIANIKGRVEVLGGSLSPLEGSPGLYDVTFRGAPILAIIATKPGEIEFFLSDAGDLCLNLVNCHDHPGRQGPSAQALFEKAITSGFVVEEKGGLVERRYMIRDSRLLGQVAQIYVQRGQPFVSRVAFEDEGQYRFFAAVHELLTVGWKYK